MKRFIFLLAVVAGFGYLFIEHLAGDPVRRAKTCLESAISLNEKAFYGCACKEERGEFMDIMVDLYSSSRSQELMAQARAASWDFSNLNYELIRKDADEAVVRASGEWDVQGIRVIGQRYIDMKIRLIKENGMWKVCGVYD